jgi:hypothetical protein
MKLLAGEEYLAGLRQIDPRDDLLWKVDVMWGKESGEWKRSAKYRALSHGLPSRALWN